MGKIFDDTEETRTFYRELGALAKDFNKKTNVSERASRRLAKACLYNNSIGGYLPIRTMLDIHEKLRKMYHLDFNKEYYVNKAIELGVIDVSAYACGFNYVHSTWMDVDIEMNL